MKAERYAPSRATRRPTGAGLKMSPAVGRGTKRGFWIKARDVFNLDRTWDPRWSISRQVIPEIHKCEYAEIEETS